VKPAPGRVPADAKTGSPLAAAPGRVQQPGPRGHSRPSSPWTQAGAPCGRTISFHPGWKRASPGQSWRSPPVPCRRRCAGLC